jgi:hypothetical protein
MTFDRRHLLKSGSAALASTLLRKAHSQTPTATCAVRLTDDVAASVPQSFIGLSYESPQLANPAFFSAQNAALVSLFRDLAPQGGVLRTGGNLSAFTGWRSDPSMPITPAEQAAMDKGKHYWEWALTDPTIRNGSHQAVLTPASVSSLAGFLEATGWKAIYGLNFGTGTPQQAAEEVACVMQLAGRHVLAFQLGNEIDFWRGGLRDATWDFTEYLQQWQQWVKVIHARTPDAPFGGPDVAVNLGWVEQLAAAMGPRLALLSKHHYAMGPAGGPGVDAARLLGPDPEIAHEIAAAQRATAIAGVPFHNTESGSCYHGGQPGVSDAFASALWGADYLLALAQGGHAGVNMHGGGNGFYSPIVGDAQSGFVRRPIFYGMQLAQQFCGSTLLHTETTSSANATAYAARTGQGLHLALVNKSAAPVAFSLEGKLLRNRKLQAGWKLSAPSLSSQTDVTLAAWKPALQGQSSQTLRLDLEPYTAATLQLS